MGYSDKDRAEELRRRADNVPRFTYVVNVRTCPVCHSKDIKKIASNGKLVGVLRLPKNRAFGAIRADIDFNTTIGKPAHLHCQNRRSSGNAESLSSQYPKAFEKSISLYSC